MTQFSMKLFHTNLAMELFRFVAFAALAVSAVSGVAHNVNQGYGSAAAAAAAAAAPSSTGDSSSYGNSNSDPYCETVYDTVSDHHCEEYVERTCRTTHKESCSDVADRNCRAVVSGRQDRKCFDVTEKICKLQEEVKFDTIQIPVTVQKCSNVNERICNTVYDTDQSTQTKRDCIDVTSPMCETKTRVLDDKRCRTTTEFDCQTSSASYPEPAASGYGSSSSGSGSSGADNYGSSDQQSASASASSDGYHSTTSGYGRRESNCRRKTNTKCYQMPRTVTYQDCHAHRDTACEDLTVSVPSPVARQSCRNEPRKVCSLEERNQAKQVKRFEYNVKCRSVPRRVCENVDLKELVPSCAEATRQVCTYTPSETCEETPKKHCVEVKRRVAKQRCSSRNGGGGEEAQQGQSQGQGQGQGQGGTARADGDYADAAQMEAIATQAQQSADIGY